MKACTSSELRLGRTVAFSYIAKDKKEVVKIVAEVCETSKRKRSRIKEEVCESLKAIIPITPKDILFVPPLLIKKTTSGKIKRYYIKHKFMIGRIKYWESFYLLYFIRSQILIIWLRLSYTLKEKLALNKELKLNRNKDTGPHESRQ